MKDFEVKDIARRTQCATDQRLNENGMKFCWNEEEFKRC